MPPPPREASEQGEPLIYFLTFLPITPKNAQDYAESEYSGKQLSLSLFSLVPRTAA
jgi:hypothetical protein